MLVVLCMWYEMDINKQILSGIILCNTVKLQTLACLCKFVLYIKVLALFFITMYNVLVFVMMEL